MASFIIYLDNGDDLFLTCNVDAEICPHETVRAELQRTFHMRHGAVARRLTVANFRYIGA